MKHLKKYNESLDSSKEKEFEDELMDSIYQNGKKEDGKYILTIPEMKQVAKEMILWMKKNPFHSNLNEYRNAPLYTYRPEPLSEKEKVKDFIGNKLGKNYFVSCVDDGIQIYGKHQQSVEYIKDKVAKILNVSSEYLTTYFNTIIITDSNLNLILKETKNKII